MRRGFAAWVLTALLLAGCAALVPAGTPEEKAPTAAEEPEPPRQEVPAAETPGPPAPEEPALETPEPADTDFVRVKDYIPEIAVDLRYATADNFCGQAVYDFSEAYLRYGTVKKLSAAQEALAAQGYGLKLWDAFRPVQAQFTLWEICPDSRYVADPNRGYSSHSRGNTVDVTLFTASGEEVEMPTGFDDFSALADRDYSDVADPAAANAQLLETVMTDAGFQPYFGEWWHFSDMDAYEVAETPILESEDEGNA